MLRELFRIGEALLVTTGIAGACFGIPIALFWLVIKLGSNRNEDRVCDVPEGDCFQATVINSVSHSGINTTGV